MSPYQSGGPAEFNAFFTNIKIGHFLRKLHIYPYGIAGVGYIRSIAPRIETNMYRFDLKKSQWGVNLGAGIEFIVLKRLNLFAEVNYVLMDNSDNTTSFLPVKLGIITPFKIF